MVAASQSDLPGPRELVLGIPVSSTRDAPDSCLLVAAFETDLVVVIEMVPCVTVSSI